MDRPAAMQLPSQPDPRWFRHPITPVRVLPAGWERSGCAAISASLQPQHLMHPDLPALCSRTTSVPRKPALGFTSRHAFNHLMLCSSRKTTREDKASCGMGSGVSQQQEGGLCAGPGLVHSPRAQFCVHKGALQHLPSWT